jgi:hypothetical protein
VKLSLLVIVLAGCSGCPSTPPAADASAEGIYQALQTAGCMQATDGGLQAIQQEMGAPSPPAWFQCLENGGTVQSCGGCPR